MIKGEQLPHLASDLEITVHSRQLSLRSQSTQLPLSRNNIKTKTPPCYTSFIFSLETTMVAKILERSILICSSDSKILFSSPTLEPFSTLLGGKNLKSLHLVIFNCLWSPKECSIIKNHLPRHKSLSYIHTLFFRETSS